MIVGFVQLLGCIGAIIGTRVIAFLLSRLVGAQLYLMAHLLDFYLDCYIGYFYKTHLVTISLYQKTD